MGTATVPPHRDSKKENEKRKLGLLTIRVMLCVKMGVVSKSMKWQDTVKGLPQGAVLSPLLANLYLHSFDQFVTSRTQAYVRYADDFVILARSKEEAEKFNAESTTYITQRLKLPLNFARIDSFQLRSGKLDKASTKKWSGIVAYYGVLLPEEELQKIDGRFFSFLHDALAKDWKSFSNKNILMTFLDEFRFLSTDFRLKDKELKSQLIQTYLSSKKTSSAKENDIENNKIILKRKQEYIRKESENSELVIAKPGAVIGLSKKGVSIKIQGKVLKGTHKHNDTQYFGCNHHRRQTYQPAQSHQVLIKRNIILIHNSYSKKIIEDEKNFY